MRLAPPGVTRQNAPMPRKPKFPPGPFPPPPAIPEWLAGMGLPQGSPLGDYFDAIGVESLKGLLDVARWGLFLVWSEPRSRQLFACRSQDAGPALLPPACRDEMP
jgi:hypothetical protein